VVLIKEETPTGEEEEEQSRSGQPEDLLLNEDGEESHEPSHLMTNLVTS